MHLNATCVVSLAQIFDVRLNGQLNVVDDLDIFSEAGYAIAHDVHIPFIVEEDELEANGVKTEFTGILNVEFVKVSVFLSKIACCRGVSKVPECRRSSAPGWHAEEKWLEDQWHE